MDTDEASPVSSGRPLSGRGLLSTALVSFFFTAFAGFLWIGRGRLAVAYLVVAVGFLTACFAAILAGVVDADIVAQWFFTTYSDFVALAVAAASTLLVLAFRHAGRPAKWFSSGWMVVPALLIFFGTMAVTAVLVRSFLFEPFSTPAGSMGPNIVEGDYVAAAKWPYGYSRYSFPFGLVPVEGRMFGLEPKRGDVIVFRYPPDPTIVYIKRVIGLPGERISTVGGVPHINGIPLDRVATGEIDDETLTGEAGPVAAYRETLSNGATYITLDRGSGGPLDDTREMLVKEGTFFVMGDNRDNSADSRVWGLVPFGNLVGRIDRIFWNARGLPISERSVRLMRAD
jgi:signal peptidase I